MFGQVTSRVKGVGNHLPGAGPKDASHNWCLTPFSLLPVLLVGIAVTCISAGIACLWLHWQGGPPVTFRAAGGILLTLSGLVQLRLTWRAWATRRTTTGLPFSRRRLFWRWLLVGFVLCYTLGLVLGPDPGAQYVFWTSMAWWHTAVLVPITATTKTLQRVANVLQRRAVRLVGWSIYGVLITVLGTELGLRTYALLSHDPVAETYVAQRGCLRPGSTHQGRQVNALGYWDDEFHEEPKPGTYRIAALGDGITLSGTAQTNFLTQLEEIVPGVEIYNFGIAGAGPREYAAQTAAEVVRYRPDLVLVIVSVGSDVTDERPLPGVFDWQGLRIYQFGSRLLTTNVSLAPAMPTPSRLTNRQEYVRRRARQLAVCRTPINDTLRKRWQSSLAHLDDVIAHCNRHTLDVALVLAPAKFQINDAVFESMRRHMGYESSHVDLELPQRRLKDFAVQRRLPVLDLLPHFRAANETLFVRDGDRWNEQGNATAARVLGAWLRDCYASQLAASLQSY